MAQIDIEKKKKNTFWPWLLLLLVILAAVVYFMIFSDDDDTDMDAVTTEEVMTDENSVEEGDAYATDQETMAVGGTAVATYSEFVGTTGDMGIDHNYSNQALKQLIDAVRQTADSQNVDISADLAEASSNAKTITEDPEALIHADLIKESFAILNRAMATIQEQKFPEMQSEVEALTEEVASIDPAVETLNQKAAVNSYFKKAADVLNQMQ